MKLHAIASAAEVNKDNCAGLNSLGHEVLRFLESTGRTCSCWIKCGLPVCLYQALNVDCISL